MSKLGKEIIKTLKEAKKNGLEKLQTSFVDGKPRKKRKLVKRFLI